MKLPSRLAVIAGCCALALLAEDFWAKKSYTDWTDKDATKILQNSPWSHQVSVSLGGPQIADNTGGTSRGRGRGGGGMGDTTSGAVGEPNMNGPNSRGRGSGGGGAMENMPAPSMMLTVRWQSALPVRQALVISRLGHAKAGSEEATRFLTQAMPGYVLGLIGLPGGMAHMPADRLNEIAKTSTVLKIKDKDPIPAQSAEAVSRENVADLYFIFPKTTPITLEDKEVEFSVNVGRIEVKRKFKLKDMMVGDKLEL